MDEHHIWANGSCDRKIDLIKCMQINDLYFVVE